MHNTRVLVQTADFDVAAETARLRHGGGDIGAVVTFTGVCRSDSGRLVALELEHYPGMAENEIKRIATEASGRWALDGLTIIHRFGRIAAGENIVLVVTASTHRQSAFEAAEFLMDFLKTHAPFWKKEHLAATPDKAWVTARALDDAATERWSERSR